mgnify:CR=1 FL=1
MEKQHITLVVPNAVKDWLALHGFDPRFGARPLKRAIQKYVEDTLAEEIIASQISEGDKILETNKLKVTTKYNVRGGFYTTCIEGKL